jgi:hypothetical protein
VHISQGTVVFSCSHLLHARTLTQVPYVIRNIPELVSGPGPASARGWGDDARIEALAGPSPDYDAETADNVHFMYFRAPRPGSPAAKDFKPPTTATKMGVRQWLDQARATAADILAEEEAQVDAAWFAPAAVRAAVAEGAAATTKAGGGDPAVRSAALNPPLSPRAAPPLRPPALPEDLPASLRTLHPDLTAASPGLPPQVWYGRPLGGLAALVPPPAVPRAPNAVPANASFAVPARASGRMLHYLRISTTGLRKKSAWISDELPMLTPKASHFMVDPAQQRGIHCRFGMPGIIAESHYDVGRNFLAVLRGVRRYILSPPSECDRLAMLPSGPFARHSGADWTAREGIEAVSHSLARSLCMAVFLNMHCSIARRPRRSALRRHWRWC